MENRPERNWTAHIVLTSEHAGLRPEFKRLEAELFRVLARVDEPHEVRNYLAHLIGSSKFWFIAYESLHPKK